MSTQALRSWEVEVIDAVGAVIDHWGFKFNHGRLWALLFLRGEPMEASELQEVLGLSKGAVSMITRELEFWGVITRAREGATGRFLYSANTEFMEMIGRVFRDREAPLIARVQADLAHAEQAARDSGGAPPDVLERIGRMRRLAALMQRSLEAFQSTSQLDLRAMVGAFTSGARRRLSGRS